MMKMNIKKKLAMTLSLMLVLTAGSASFAEGTATPDEAQKENAPLVELITPKPKAEETPTPTPEPTATPTAEPTAKPEAEQITPPPAQNTAQLLSSGGDEDKTVAAPGATWTIDGDSLIITITGEAGLQMAVFATIGEDYEVYAGETVTFSGLEAGKSYDLEVDYCEVQKGVSAYRTTIDVPAASGDTQTTPPASTETTPPASTETTPPVSAETTPPVSAETTPPASAETTPPASTETTPPASSGAEALTPPPSGDAQTTPPAAAQTTPPASTETTPPAGSETTPPDGPTQFDLAVSEQDGVITAEITGASQREVDIVLLLNGSTIDLQALIGNGSVSFSKQGEGSYTVRAAYVTPADGITAVEKTVTIGSSAAQPVVKEIAFSAAGGTEKIDVSITEASNLPVTIRILKDGWEIAKKTIAAGVGSESFTGLNAGTYSVSVNYDPAQSGVSAKEQANITVTAKTAGITIASVAAGENVLTVTGTAQPGADIALTTTPAASAAAIVRADANGAFSAQITLQAGTYTQVRAAYVADNSIYAVKDGTFAVAAPASKPPLTVDPIRADTQKVVAKTNPGVTVNLRVKAYNYGQTVVADSSGLLKYSLPQTYPKGTEVTFTVYYGTNNAQSYVTTVTVSKAKAYTVLQYGDTGDDVEEMTERLRDLGYMEDDVRRYSSAVREAVKRFQQLNGLEPDGIAGQATLAALYSIGAIPYNASLIGYPTLVRGDKGLAAIYRLQERLKDLGYYTIAVDGIYGSGTERAVRHFQRINGLGKTGVADNATQQLLYSSSAKAADSAVADGYKLLSRSSKYHPAVVPLQRRLKALGYAVGSADGYFGSRTYRAVREFQKRNGLSATGVADEKMQRVLFSSSAVAASGSSSSSSSGSVSYRLLTWGSRGDDVKKLQKALLNKGYTQVRVADGVYGEWTYNAVRAFQKDRGLAVDGIAGKDTQNALYGTKY